MTPLLIDPIIKNALKEDYTWGDVTSESIIDPDNRSNLSVVLKEDGVIAGLDVAARTFLLVDDQIKWTSLVADGKFVQKNTVLARVEGNSRSLLIAERVALNLLQRMSGIASQTNKFVKEIEKTGSKSKLLDTRKTTPGLRILEKYSVKMGGGFNHRHNLSDSVLIKDNHLSIIEASGKNIQDVLISLKQNLPHTVKIEVEVDTIDQIPDLLKVGVDTILLDNMSSNQLAESVKLVNGRAFTEASGGININNIAEISKTGVDFISVGALTHSQKALDISLDYS